MREFFDDMSGALAGDPRHDHRHPQTAFARIELRGGERRCRRTGPTGADRDIGARPPEPVDVARVLSAEPQPSDQQLVRIGGFGAVVGEEHEHRAFVLAGRAQLRDHAAELLVHRRRHACVDLHAPGVMPTVVRRQRIPVSRLRHHRRIGRDQSERRRAVAPLAAQRLPARVVTAAVAVDRLARRLQRDVVGLEGEIEEERLIRRAPSVLAQITECAVDEELRGVVLARHRRLAVVLEPVDLVGEREIALTGVPVVGPAVALHQRSIEAAGAGQVVGFLAEVPLADRIGPVASVAQQRGERHHTAIEHGEVARLAVLRERYRLAHRADSGAVVVDAGEQHGPRRRAFGGDMEACETCAARRQRIERGRGDLAAEGTDIGVAPVVDHDQHDVRAVGRRHRWGG